MRYYYPFKGTVVYVDGYSLSEAKCKFKSLFDNIDLSKITETKPNTDSIIGLECLIGGDQFNYDGVDSTPRY